MIKVIKASAGSGKTYQLTYEYIKMLLGVKRKGRYVLADKNDKERHRHILAVTFTNKATAEMKERIVKELLILKGHYPDEKSDYIDDLCRDFGNVSHEDIQEAADRAVTDILHDYTNFNVSTIDSFFQMILRTFAKELKMSYNYGVEIDNNHVINVGMFDMFSSLAHSLGKNKEELARALRIKAWLKEFSKDEVLNGGNWNVFRTAPPTSKKKNNKAFTLKKFMECLNKEDLREHLAQVVQYIDLVDANSSQYYISLFKERLYAKMLACRRGIIKARDKFLSIGASEGFYELNSRGGMFWLNRLDDNLDKLLSEIHEKTICNPEKWYLTIREGRVKKLLSDAAVSAMTAEFNRIKAFANYYFIYKDIHRNIYMLGLLGEVKRCMEEYRKENEMILLGDTNDLLQRIINKEDTPFIYERVGMWLSHFLIDEFQDTSRAQWENIKPLLFNSCAEGSDNLIIGDEKQCIYRFRNADPSLLRSEVGNNFTVKQNDGTRSFNWRSMPNVINFNNDFFSSLAKSLNMTDDYKNVEQDIPKKKKHPNPGYVEVSIINEAAENDALKEASQSDDAVEVPKLKYNDIVLNRIVSVIKNLKSRGYRNKDIAVLVFSNEEGGEVVQHLLNYNNQVTLESEKINIVSDESLQLKNCSSVRLIISYLRYLDTKLLLTDDNADEISDKIKERMDNDGYIHRVLRHYERLMHTHGIEPGEALVRSINDVPRHEQEDSLSLNSLLPDNTESFSIVSITEHIIAQNISAHNLERDNAFIQAFQDCVLDFSNRPNPSIHEFLKWWDKGGCNISVNSPEGQDAVNVLTIHKSKGLEYNCVILPFCNWSLGGMEEVIWVPKDVAVDGKLFSGMSEKLIPPVFPIMPNAKMEINQSAIGQYCESLLKERVFDALNKTYVAFTRAIDEMYIFTKDWNKKEKENSDVRKKELSYFLCQLDTVDNKYIFGEKGHYVPKDKDKEHKKAQTPDNEAKKNALPVKMPLYHVNNIKLEYKVNELVTNERQERGIRLHKVMNRIHSMKDVDKALLYFKVRGVIPAACFDEDSRTLKEALSLKDVQWWFDSRNRVYNERTLVDNTGKEIRPDRFFITPDGRTVVVDYKFGRMTPSTIKEHSEQVLGYIDALKSCGCENVEGYLWFPLEGERQGAITKVK